MSNTRAPAGGRRWSASALVAALALSLLSAWSPPATGDAAGKGGDFVPFGSPTRIVDTRNGTGGVTGVRGAGSTTAFPVLGAGGVPSSGVSAVLVDVTPISPTATTWFKLWADGTTMPPVFSNVNIPANGATISNSAVVPVGANGKIALFNNSGSVHVVIDVHGYFTTTTGGSGRGGFVPVTQGTLFDTAAGVGGVPKAMIPARGSLTVQVTGGVVPAGANAIYLDVLVNASAASWLRATSTGESAANGTSIEFPGGASSSGLMIKPSADGRVTFYNASSAGIHLGAVLFGYFSANATEGAGYRPAIGRLLDAVQVAGNSTIDVQVAGMLGMPATGVAAVALNLTVSATDYGFLKAWPTGTAEPGSALNHFGPNATHADMALVQVGAEGGIRIRNTSPGAIRMSVDVQGLFSGPITPVAVRPYTRMTAFQTAPVVGATRGTVEYSYVDNIGRLVHIHQPDPDNFSTTQITTIPANDAFSGPASMTQLSDGRLQVIGQSTSSEALSSTRTGNAWAAWSSLGGWLPGPPVVAKLPDGGPVVFAADADGVLWRRLASGTNTEWRVLGDMDIAGEVTAVTVRDGIQVFAVDKAGAMRTGLYTAAGQFTGVTSLGGAGLSGVPAVVVYPGFRLRVVVRGADGVVHTKLQDVSGTYPATWDAVGSLAITGSPTALLSPNLGTTEIVVRGTDDELYSTGETIQGSGTWRPWARALKDGIGEPISDPSATDPTAFPVVNANGSSWAFAFRNLNNQAKVYWVNPNATTSRAATLPQPSA